MLGEGGYGWCVCVAIDVSQDCARLMGTLFAHEVSAAFVRSGFVCGVRDRSPGLTCSGAVVVVFFPLRCGGFFLIAQTPRLSVPPRFVPPLEPSPRRSSWSWL